MHLYRKSLPSTNWRNRLYQLKRDENWLILLVAISWKECQKKAIKRLFYHQFTNKFLSPFFSPQIQHQLNTHLPSFDLLNTAHSGRFKHNVWYTILFLSKGHFQRIGRNFDTGRKQGFIEITSWWGITSRCINRRSVRQNPSKAFGQCACSSLIALGRM